MKNIGKKLFLVSFMLAVFSGFLVYMFIQTYAMRSEPEKTTVVVAAENIYPGTQIVDEMLVDREIPDEALNADVVKDRSSIVGKYTKETIFANEQIQLARISGEAVSALGVNLQGNNRAVTIRSSGAKGVAHLIKPGDYVDVVAYLPAIEGEARIVRPNLTQIILQKSLVLAIDKQIVRDDEVGTTIPEGFLVTLAVPIWDVEKLVLAETEGTLSLALRPEGDNNIYRTDGAVWEEIMLDEFDEMKDFFPEYNIRRESDVVIQSGDVSYTSYVFYTIKYGDTLRSIAQDFYGDPNRYVLLKQVNKIDDENLILSGTGIKVPVLEQ